MGVIEGGHNMNEVLLAMQQSIQEHMALFAVIFLVLCVMAAAGVYLGRRSKNKTAAKEGERAEMVEEITLDLTEQTEELRVYADAVHTLVDIGYFSETEVIE